MQNNVFEKALIKGACVGITHFEETREGAERFIKLFAEQFDAEYKEQEYEGSNWFYLNKDFPISVKVTAFYEEESK